MACSNENFTVKILGRLRPLGRPRPRPKSLVCVSGWVGSICGHPAASKPSRLGPKAFGIARKACKEQKTLAKKLPADTGVHGDGNKDDRDDNGDHDHHVLYTSR